MLIVTLLSNSAAAMWATHVRAQRGAWGLANGDEPRIIHSDATIGRAAPRRQLHAASPALTHRRSAAHAVAGSHAAGAGARQGTPQATAPSPTPRRRIPPP